MSATSRWSRNAVTCWRRAWARHACSCRAWVRGIGWTTWRICGWWPRWIRSSGIITWSARDGRVPGRPAAVVWNARTIHRHRLITSSTKLCKTFYRFLKPEEFCGIFKDSSRNFKETIKTIFHYVWWLRQWDSSSCLLQDNVRVLWKVIFRAVLCRRAVNYCVTPC